MFGVLLKRIRSFFYAYEATSAVEFALVAPLLVIVLGITVELGRLTMAYRQFQSATVGIARHIVRYPEYEMRSRDYSPAVFTAVFPKGNMASMNVVVYSLVKSGNMFQEVFPKHILMGKDTGIDWKNFVNNSNYVDNEAVVLVSAQYNFQTLLLTNAFNVNFQKKVIIIPPFSRSFIWNDGKVSDKYVY